MKQNFIGKELGLRITKELINEEIKHPLLRGVVLRRKIGVCKTQK